MEVPKKGNATEYMYILTLTLEVNHHHFYSSKVSLLHLGWGSLPCSPMARTLASSLVKALAASLMRPHWLLEMTQEVLREGSSLPRATRSGDTRGVRANSGSLSN